MKVRIEYYERGIPTELLKAPLECLSADAEVFLEFVQQHMKTEIREPKFTRYEIKVEVMK